MKLTILSYDDLLDPTNIESHKNLEKALLQKGIVGIRGVPDYEKTVRAYINAAREFCALPETVKERYTPLRDEGANEGYESGAEKFKNEKGEWQFDDKKASYYAFVPDSALNKWPEEVDFRTPYLALGHLIFRTGKVLLNVLGLNEKVGLEHDKLTGYGRMLHYQKEGDTTNANPDWCGSHFDHSVFTGLIPAYYYFDGKEIDEPAEAGLYIKLNPEDNYEKIDASDKSILLFQVGEFSQLLSNDRIRATKHIVKKAHCGIERFTFALFYNPDYSISLKSQSVLTKDPRYIAAQSADKSVTFAAWDKATTDYWRAK